MTHSSDLQLPLEPNPWSTIARFCRRICLLRECGRDAEAEAVRRGALQEALAAVRHSGEAEETIAARLEATFAAEADRVANASVLAELLAPLLTARPVSQDPFGASAWPPAAPPEAIAPAPLPSPVPDSPAPAAPRAAPGDISLFIDEMIAQQRSAHAPRRTG